LAQVLSVGGLCVGAMVLTRSVGGAPRLHRPHVVFALLLWVADFHRCTAFLREVHIQYTGTSAGHFELGRSIGAAMGEDIRTALASDPEMSSLRDFTAHTPGSSIYLSLLTESSKAFPLYLKELEGMAVGASVPVRDILISNFREELLQFVADSEIPSERRRQGRCSTAYVATEDTTAFGHNDDWDRDWRNASYLISGVEVGASGQMLRRWTSWTYPTYLPGMDITFNDHGVVYTVQSLFPKSFPRSGVGTAFVARYLLEATSLEDAVLRASDPRVAAAMVYNLGSVSERRMVELEVNSRGQVYRRDVTRPSFHGNQFVLANVSQFPEKSSTHRSLTWDRLRPSTVSALKDFLGDTSDPAWPVYRTMVPPDKCQTEVSAVVDLRAAKLSVWTTNPSSTPPVAEYSIVSDMWSLNDSPPALQIPAFEAPSPGPRPADSSLGQIDASMSIIV